MRFETPGGHIDVSIRKAVVAGWTGRDQAAVDHHIEELAALGVAPPSEVPLYYRVSRDLLTTCETVEVLGLETSGEVEPLIVNVNGELWLGLASDHTDRALEAVSVAASKQVCAKPIARDLWPLEEVAAHLDTMVLTCDIEENGKWVRYQDGTLENIRPLPDLAANAQLDSGSAMLCGTLPAIGGVRPAARYRMSLTDPLLDRSISLAYSVTALPSVS